MFYMPVINNLFISSSGDGVILSNNNSRLSLNVNPPMRLTANAKCRVLSSSFWYDFPNVSDPDNRISFTYNNFPYLFIFEEGIYAPTDIIETLKEKLSNIGLPVTLFEIQIDDATSKTSLRVNNGAIQFSMNYESNNGIFKNLFGFTSVHTSPNTWEESTNKAKFNKVNKVIVHSSFCNSGYFEGSGGSDILQIVPIKVGPNSQITTEQRNPLICKVNETQIDSLVIYLTSEDGKTPLKTSEPWTMSIEFFTDEPLNISNIMSGGSSQRVDFLY